MAILAVAIGAAALSVCWLPCAIATGRALGLEVQRLQIGHLPVLELHLGGVPISVGLLPVGSWVKFKGSDPAPADDPEAVEHAGPGRRDWLALPAPLRALAELVMWLLAVTLLWPLLGAEPWPAFGRGFSQLLSVLSGSGPAHAAELVRRSADGIDAALVGLLAAKLCALNVLALTARYLVTVAWSGERGTVAAGLGYLATYLGLGIAWVALTVRAMA
jgi:hypothetical protein